MKNQTCGRALALFILFCGCISFGSTSDVGISLRTSKSIYRLGDKIVFEFVFRNASPHAIKFFPDPETYDTRSFEIRRTDGKGSAVPLQFAETSVYYATWSKDAVVLAPGASYTWKVPAELQDHLPRDWNDRTPGLYLIFEGVTAFRLPGIGSYSIKAKYNFSKKHPVVEFITGNPKLWFGKLQSDSITVDFEK